MHKVFISHGKEDSWVASQLAHRAREAGAATFLDETDVSKGDNFKSVIHREIQLCNELLALFTPWSANRFWVWSEIGAVWGQGKRVVAVLYGLDVKDLEEVGGSKGVFEDINILRLNDVERYFIELNQRVMDSKNG